jgi:hypothetical protein
MLNTDHNKTFKECGYEATPIWKIEDVFNSSPAHLKLLIKRLIISKSPLHLSDAKLLTIRHSKLYLTPDLDMSKELSPSQLRELSSAKESKYLSGRFHLIVDE